MSEDVEEFAKLGNLVRFIGMFSSASYLSADAGGDVF